jgi:hypothetical protein
MKPHPSGYPRAPDSPAHIAPALELRRAIEAAQKGAVEDAVAFTLAFPIVERTRPFESEESTNPEVPVHPIGDEPDTFVDMPAVDPERTLERDPYRDRDSEQTLQATESEVLTRSLQSIGEIDEPNSSAGKVLLGRARAIRFRLALLELWPDDFSPSRTADDLLELAIHPAVVVALADDPIEEAAAIAAIVDDVRARFPAVTRSTLRDTTAAAAARVTLLGGARAIDYIRTRFAELPGKQRRDALGVAQRLANTAARLDALRLVTEALS